MNNPWEVTADIEIEILREINININNTFRYDTNIYMISTQHNTFKYDTNIYMISTQHNGTLEINRLLYSYYSKDYYWSLLYFKHHTTEGWSLFGEKGLLTEPILYVCGTWLGGTVHDIPIADFLYKTLGTNDV